MKRIVAVVILVVMVLNVAVVCAENRKETADSLIVLAKDVMQETLEMYKKDGALNDGNLELALNYFMLYVAANRMSACEDVYPESALLSIKHDTWAETEYTVILCWKRMMDGELERKKFETLLMGFIEMHLAIK